ncbi:hypothetical protein HYPSUDRAFT_38300 [Hypholoma sublateritium FD-334 SS-4]|uniref:Uncharacterized protein n=1 Tax=Hypholoma sublateritium (strain FD-334 SS-4) TaxID=945553 RepID=A0A0D2P1U9_HYPSF|nr:hypothetical protein HYPSUDRAFT_38300 [Hypholoma sublateritium FD-334 SS-4]
MQPIHWLPRNGSSDAVPVAYRRYPPTHPNPTHLPPPIFVPSAFTGSHSYHHPSICLPN